MNKILNFWVYLGALLLALAGTDAFAADFVVVTNSTQSEMSAVDLKKALLGQKNKWEDGSDIIIVLPPKGSEASL